MRYLLLLVLLGCSQADVIEPVAPQAQLAGRYTPMEKWLLAHPNVAREKVRCPECKVFTPKTIAEARDLSAWWIETHPDQFPRIQLDQTAGGPDSWICSTNCGCAVYSATQGAMNPVCGSVCAGCGVYYAYVHAMRPAAAWMNEYASDYAGQLWLRFMEHNMCMGHICQTDKTEVDFIGE